jgi:hypothetical protein
LFLHQQSSYTLADRIGTSLAVKVREANKK